MAAIQTFSDEAKIIERANDTVYGLVVYVFTEDYRRGLRVSDAPDFGMIGLNRGLASDPAAPLDGMTQSDL